MKIKDLTNILHDQNLITSRILSSICRHIYCENDIMTNTVMCIANIRYDVIDVVRNSVNFSN